MSWILFEPCAGSAALTMHMMGGKHAVLPYQGSKWKFRKVLAGLIANHTGGEPPERALVRDPAPWGVFLGMLFDDRCEAIIERLDFLNRLDPREVYDILQNRDTPSDKAVYAAEFLFLQRLAFSGKAVSVRDGKWVSPGFNKTSAYGTPATDKFGEVKPMIESLIRTLRKTPRTGRVIASQRRASNPLKTDHLNMVTYIDPPYQGGTKYPDGDFSRQQVLSLARDRHERGDLVIISEAEPLKELVDRGWSMMALQGPKTDSSPFKGKQEEWLTYNVPDWRN